MKIQITTEPMHDLLGMIHSCKRCSSKNFESLILAQTLLFSPLQVPELELIWNEEKAIKGKQKI
jgi:hypothetical protein